MYGNNLLNTFIENIAAIIIGKSIGKELLGTYQIAKNIAIIPASFVKNNISNILFSSFSKIQNDKDQFKNINGLILKTFSILFIPLVIFLFSASKNIIIILYGQKMDRCRTSAIFFIDSRNF